MNCLRSTLALACFVSLACDPGSKSVTDTAGIDDEGSASGSGSGSSAESGTEEGGESGEESGTTGDYGGVCEHTSTELTGINDIGPTGIAPQEIIDDAVGVFNGAITWQLNEGPVLYQGAAGPTPVEIEIAYNGGGIRDLEAELVQPCNHDGPCPCNSRVEMDAQLRIVSEDGVLDETWTVVLSHGSDGDFGPTPPRTSIYHRFDPDQTAGTLGRDSFQIAADHRLDDLILQGDFEDGAFGGGFIVEVTIISGPAEGSIGAGGAADIGAVTSLDACAGLFSSSCEAAGCTLVTGIPIYGQDDSCSCGDADQLCFGGPLTGDPIPTLYTRPDRYEDGLDNVFLLDTLIADPPAPWRSCADAPEVPSCSCSGDCG